MLRKVNVISVAALLVYVCSGSVAFADSWTIDKVKKTLSVSSNYRANSKPDILYFIMDVSTGVPKLSDAYNKNQSEVSALLAKIKRAGYKDSQITVEDSIRFFDMTSGIYQNAYSTLVVVKLDITGLNPKDVRKKIFNFEEIASTIKSSNYSSPGNQEISSLQSRFSGPSGSSGIISIYSTSKYKELKKKAIIDGMKEIENQAKTIAKSLGVKIKKAVSLSGSTADDIYSGINQLQSIKCASLSPEKVSVVAMISAEYAIE